MPISSGVNAPTLSVLHAMLDRQAGGTTGLDIGVRTHLGSGTVLPTLARLERLHWVESHWQERDPGDPTRSRRRLYELSPSGAQVARQSLREAERRHSAWTKGLRPARGAA